MKEKYNFSEVMVKIAGVYKCRVYMDDVDYRKDSFICPRCKDVISFEQCNGYIEEIDTKSYICPFCHEKF